MKRVWVIFFLVLCPLVGDHRVYGQETRPSPATPSRGIPFVTGVSPAAAPIGSVIQLRIQSDVDDPKVLTNKFRLMIGQTTAEFYPTYNNDRNTIVAVVPTQLVTSGAPSDGKAVPVVILFSELQTGELGIPFLNFSVLRRTGLTGKEVEISGVTPLGNNYFEVTFNDYIPTELWPATTLYFDGKKADRIMKMEERSFIALLPGGVRDSGFNVFARVGDKETSAFKYDKYASPSPSPTLTLAQEIPVSASSKWPWVILAVLVVGGAVAIFLWQFLSKRSTPQPPTPPAPVTEITSEKIDLPEELPEALVDACIKNECVLYAGAGLGAQSGFPTWGDFIWQLLRWAQDNGFINEAEASDYRLEVVRGQADPVADSVVSRLTTEQQQVALNDYLQEVFLKQVSPSALHEQIKKIKFSAILTANFDTLLETVYGVKGDDIYTPKDSDKLLSALTRRAFFILKLYGRLDKKETVIVSSAQYEDGITDNELFSQFMQTLFFSRTLLFVGASIEGIESYLKGISLPKEVARTHYAIVAVNNQGAWKAKAELLERRYGIQVLPFTPSKDYAELKTFLEKLTHALSTRRVAPAGGTQKVSRLQRVILQNIGPFEYLNLELDLSFDHKWHIFLGDNGVGKSTVLKAIALALCGKEAQAYAGRLLRDRRSSKDEPAQESTGTITLETDNKTSYVTTLRRNPRGDVELTSTTARPLEAEGWLAVAFPPLRTTSWDPPKTDYKPNSRPVITDLLPLVTGDVDPRLDRLKEWIVDLDYRDTKSKNPGRRSGRLIQKMFDLIGQIAEGMKLTYKGVDEQKRILIETQDGVLVPLEGLSQGTISLIGWVGIFMQRLYEVFNEDDDPTQRYALVLMDEIDAHMHPLWQRTLVSHLKKLFPQAQFIATTHSPLVISGMEAKQVVRFAKDENGVPKVLPIDPDMTTGYADQVLTSMLFDLPTTLGRPTEEKMEEFNRQEQVLGPGETSVEHEQLRKEIIADVPPWTSSHEERRAIMRQRARVLKEAGERLQQVSKEEGDLMLERANYLYESLGEKTNDQS